MPGAYLLVCTMSPQAEKAAVTVILQQAQPIPQDSLSTILTLRTLLGTPFFISLSIPHYEDTETAPQAHAWSLEQIRNDQLRVALDVGHSLGCARFTLSFGNARNGQHI
jgi:hypothetical protein